MQPAATRDARRALVLFTGGQDSTACLAWALERYAAVETVGFDHGQRDGIELECRLHVRAQLHRRFPEWAQRLGSDHLLDLAVLEQIGAVGRSERRIAEMDAGGLPNDFVPGRNLLFFTFAAMLADRRGLDVLVGGMGETDLSGYPDSRDNSLKALQVALSLGLERPLTVETPLMWLDKAQIWALTETLGGDALIDLVVEHTHSCFLGERTQRHAWGWGCSLCPSCDLRRKGYESWLAS
jgi:7-cyano-7-deazaguanine synthase